MATLITDVELTPNFFIVGFLRLEDGKRVTLEMSERSQLDRKRLASIMRQNRIVTFNGMTFDVPLIYLAIGGATLAELKLAADRIIKGGLKWWDVERELDVSIPKIDHIDLMEPNPSVGMSLKLLAGRLHARKMQDTPFEHDQLLTPAEMDVAISYNNNDLDHTALLFETLKEPIELREALGKEYGLDLRSKSDAQAGEAIVKKRVEMLTKGKVKRIDAKPGTTFFYDIPSFFTFQTDEMKAVVETIRRTQFVVGQNLKVDLPPALTGLKIRIGESVYKLGIGGLHSSEKNRAVHSDDDYILVDADVASQYPSIIIKLGLYPKSLGPNFQVVYAHLREERVAAKRAKQKTKAETGKIVLNGVYGKLGSAYSILFAPHLMIATTLTGQLSLLMLIERAELAGISVVSGNTDGVVFKVRRDMVTFDEDPESKTYGMANGGKLFEIIKQWERDTGFEMETAKYRSIYNSSVNTYIAIKEDGKDKRKGVVANWWALNDLREMLKHNPTMTVMGDAIVAYITKGTPIEQTIQECTDIRQFVTVTNVRGGCTWRGEKLGRVARYYWSTDGDPILRAKANDKGTHAQVSNSAGARPLMELPDELPDDIDYARYIEEARELARDLAVFERPPPPPKKQRRWSPQLVMALTA